MNQYGRWWLFSLALLNRIEILLQTKIESTAATHTKIVLHTSERERGTRGTGVCALQFV